MSDHRARKRCRTTVFSHTTTEDVTGDDAMDCEYEDVFCGLHAPSARVPVPPLRPLEPGLLGGASAADAPGDGTGSKRAPSLSSVDRPPPQGCSEAPDSSDSEGLEDDTPEMESRWKRTSAAMGEFLQRHQNVMDALFAHEFNEHASSPCCSPGQLRNYRCVDCYCALPLCKDCMVAAHVHSPFHHVQRWTGSYFARDSLHRIGAKLHLGHDGAPCPHARDPATLVAVHTNGIHRLAVVFCECAPRQINPLQLLGACLYPATWESPATVFSFDLLNKHHLDSLHSKTPGHDFWATLCALTDNTRADAVPNRYEDLLRVSREWRALKRWKRSGQALGIARLLPNGNASAALLCPACPQPDYNMEPDWDRLVTDDNCHVYTVFIGVDGNFQAVLKRKRFDPNDRPLLDGLGYFASTESFAAYTKEHKTDDPGEHRSTCCNLKSMKALARRKGIVISGAAAGFCRHGTYLAGAMVDLRLGEKFRIIDYVVAQAIMANPHPRLRRVLTYDKGCQYGANLVTRFKSAFQDLVPIVDRMKVLVPKLHLQGHVEICRYKYSLNYTPHCGRTDGEYVERPWVECNKVSKVARDQNPGHRKDTYDDASHAWNYRKGSNMSGALICSLRKIYVKHAEAVDNFDALSRAVGPENVAAWSRESCEARVDRGEVCSVYRANRSKLPNFDSVVAALRRTDLDPDAAPVEDDQALSPTAFVQLGLDLEEDQIELQGHIKKLPKELDRDRQHDLCLRRRHLRDDITAFRLLQRIHMPTLGPTPDDIYTSAFDEDFGFPEVEHLNLPSEFANPAQRARYGFSDIADVEYKIRLGWASRELARMRAAIHAHNAFLSWKYENISGQKQGTRAQTQVNTNLKDIHDHAAIYRRHYKALANLGVKAEDARWYQPLLDSDLQNLHLHSGNSEKTGQSQRPQAWYWGGDHDADDVTLKDLEQLTLEDIRVRWFRARANKDRYSEEVDILHAEILRTHRMFASMKRIWSTLSLQQPLEAHLPVPSWYSSSETQPLLQSAQPVSNRVEGRRAYASKQASIYAQRERDADQSCVAAQHLKDNFLPAEKKTRRRKEHYGIYSYEWTYY